MPAAPSRSEVREWVASTCAMDWRAWGLSVDVAVEEFGFAVAKGWPRLRRDVRELLRDASGGAVDHEEAFGLLQDLVEEVI